MLIADWADYAISVVGEKAVPVAKALDIPLVNQDSWWLGRNIDIMIIRVNRTIPNQSPLDMRVSN